MVESGVEAQKAIRLQRIAEGKKVPAEEVNVYRKSHQDAATLPDNNWHDAWDHDGNSVIVDMAKARNIQLARIRLDRNARLISSDGEMSKRNEEGSAADVAAYKGYRKRLRDLTKTVSADLETLTTTEQLDGYVPPWPVEPITFSGEFRPTSVPTFVTTGLTVVTGQWAAIYPGGSDAGAIPKLTRGNSVMLNGELALDLSTGGILSLRRSVGTKDYRVSLDLFQR